MNSQPTLADRVIDLLGPLDEHAESTDASPVVDETKIAFDLEGDGSVHRRIARPALGERSKCIRPKQMIRQRDAAITADLAPELAVLDRLRPRTRAECAGVPRPCPFAGCRYHLALDINPNNGSLKLNRPDREIWELEHTCALDVAEEGEHTLEQVGVILNVTREGLRLIQEESLDGLRGTRAVNAIGDAPFVEREAIL